jgi:hypothetical protein
LRLMTERGALPVDDLPHRPSGRPDRGRPTSSFRSTRPRSKPPPPTGRAGSASHSPTTRPAIDAGLAGPLDAQFGSSGRIPTRRPSSAASRRSPTLRSCARTRIHRPRALPN